MIAEIINEIEQFDKITIFRHERADGDAFGSQCALALWLRKQYPFKSVFCLGNDSSINQKKFCLMDQVDDNSIQDSLAIVLDTANTERIDDQRYKTAKKIIKIDHHVVVEHYGDIELVDPKRSSTCELVLELIESVRPLNKNDQDVATLLYKGILTDTLRFTTSNTNAATLMAASRLASCDINVADISFEMFNRTRQYFELASTLRAKTLFIAYGKLAYAYITQNMIKEAHVVLEEAKDLVTEYDQLSELCAWVLFIEDEKIADTYNASIRSRGIRIDDIANRFNGGGHYQAAGVKSLTIKQTEALLIMIKDRIDTNK